MELGNRENTHFITSSKKHLIPDIFLFDGTKIADIFSVDIFLLSFLNSFKNLIEWFDFFITFFEIFFHYVFTFALTAYKGEYLIDNIRFSILFWIRTQIFVEIIIWLRNMIYHELFFVYLVLLMLYGVLILGVGLEISRNSICRILLFGGHFF